MWQCWIIIGCMLLSPIECGPSWIYIIADWSISIITQCMEVFFKKVLVVSLFDSSWLNHLLVGNYMKTSKLRNDCQQYFLQIYSDSTFSLWSQVKDRRDFVKMHGGSGRQISRRWEGPSRTGSTLQSRLQGTSTNCSTSLEASQTLRTTLTFCFGSRSLCPVWDESTGTRTIRLNANTPMALGNKSESVKLL